LLASNAQIDLLVVGTHQKAWAARAWQGSVSRGALHGAAMNVACVPRSAAAESGAPVIPFRRVLIPTDFSQLANHAIASGYGLLRPGGEAHLIHVRLPEDEEHPLRDLEARLGALIPEGASSLGIETRIHVVADHEAYAGIVRLAERLAVDAICMSTHGRSGISELMLGSQANEVVRVARQPVLLVKAARE
jgi:nucleotide-binding universal stress UspA family protein